jgi:hypothetical protein
LSASRPLKNVITVAKANGKFTDPVAAGNSISSASATNPYLVLIGPGVYTISQTLVMKPYVHVAGSGEDVTKITGAISTGYVNASSAVISGANNSALSSPTVENKGGDYNSIALYNDNASPRVTNVTAKASGGTVNFAFLNKTSSPTMTNVTATASGGVSNLGVSNSSSSSPTMTNVKAMASGGTTDNKGVQNFSSSPVIRRSTIKGTIDGLQVSGGTTTVSQSTIIGGVSSDAGGGTMTCVACDDGSGTALDADCK